MALPEKPCPWHAESINSTTGRLEILYCEVGPAGHNGSHIGEKTRDEYLDQFRVWRVCETKKLKEGDGSSPKTP